MPDITLILMPALLISKYDGCIVGANFCQYCFRLFMLNSFLTSLKPVWR